MQFRELSCFDPGSGCKNSPEESASHHLENPTHHTHQAAREGRSSDSLNAPKPPKLALKSAFSRFLKPPKCHPNRWTPSPRNTEAQGIWRQARRWNMDSNTVIPNNDGAGCGLSTFFAKIDEMCPKLTPFLEKSDFRRPQTSNNGHGIAIFGFCDV